MIDEQRIGVTGGSYGGYMTNYIATHAKRFKAYVTQRSISNELIMYANSDMQGKSTDYKSYEDFMDDWDGYMPDGSDAEDYWEDW